MFIGIPDRFRRSVLIGSACSVLLLLTACGELFDVTNPGQILDEDLESARMVQTLVTGMSGDLSVAVASVAYAGAAMSDEMAGSSNFVWVRQYTRGRATPEFDLVRWGNVQRARWVAESGAERINRLLGPAAQGDTDLTRALLLAGLSNRMLGENFCEVTFDGGPAQPRSAAFERAVEHFTQALTNAQQGGNQSMAHAARGGRAQAYLGLGNLAAAAADASQVPTEFVFNAVFSANTGRENNDVWAAGGWQEGNISAVGALPTLIEGGDPRAPWTDCSAGGCALSVGGDGVTPLYRQDKYSDRGSDIPLVKGTEMRLIEAEAALTVNDVPTAMQFINEARAFTGMAPLTALDAAEAWSHLDDERLLTLWLEGRRLNDLHRWDHPYLDGGTTYHTDDVAPRRSSCWGFGINECQTNPNLSCP